MSKVVIKTERLNIISRSIAELSSLLEQETDLEMKQAYYEMIETMRKLPGKEEWGCDWAINLTSGVTIGGLCFKGAPDAEGIVEIGYGIDETYRKKGYATEAVRGIVKWVFEHNEVKCVVAQTDIHNEISQKVLIQNGFIQDGYGVEGPLFTRKKHEKEE